MRRRTFLSRSPISTVGLLTESSSFPGRPVDFHQQRPLAEPVSGDDGYRALKFAFEKPPSDSRNWTRWWWFGRNATEEVISYDLEETHNQGIAGVELQWMLALEPEAVLSVCTAFTFL